MTYPPEWRHESDPALALRIMRAHPFAHLFSATDTPRHTRIPILTDSEHDQPTRLRAHLNAQNPQARSIDNTKVLVVFSGPSTYVSPNWRATQIRGGTYDYQQVTVTGTARLVHGEPHFRQMIDDLSALIEPQYSEVSDHPVWTTDQAQPGYIERLVPHITQFVIDIEDIEIISKLHQQFPDQDRRAVADHLDRCHRDDARAIARLIRDTLDDPQSP